MRHTWQNDALDRVKIGHEDEEGADVSSDVGLQGAVASDAALIAAVRAGDTEAFGVLYERHGVAARTVARQYTRTPADADDITADAFARVLAVLQNGGGPDEAFRAYLFTVVRRLAHAVAQGAQRVQVTDDVATFETAYGPAGSVEEPALEGFERSVVARAFAGLPERWQVVLWYTEVEGLSAAQIAPLLGLSANGVAALTYRARERLRQGYLRHHVQSASSAQCAQIAERLGAYVRGGLAARDTSTVEGHLEGCVECQALVAELSDVNRGMRAVVAPLVLGVAALGSLAPWQLGFGGELAGTVGVPPVDEGGDRGAGAAGSGAEGSGGAAAGGFAGVVAAAPPWVVATTAAVLVGLVALSVALALGAFRGESAPVPVAAPDVEVDAGPQPSPEPRVSVVPEPEDDPLEPEQDDLDDTAPGDGGADDRDGGRDPGDDRDRGEDRDDGRDPGDDPDDGRDPGDEDPGDEAPDDEAPDDEAPDDEAPGDDEPDEEELAPEVGFGPGGTAEPTLVVGQSTPVDVLIVNSGTGPASDLTAQITLPAGVVHESPSSAGAGTSRELLTTLPAGQASAAAAATSWACESGAGPTPGPVTCQLAELAAGASSTISLALGATATPSDDVTATITIAVSGPDMSEAVLSLPVTITEVLELQVPAGEIDVHADGSRQVVEVATVRNWGREPLDDVMVEVVVPFNLYELAWDSDAPGPGWGETCDVWTASPEGPYDDHGEVQYVVCYANEVPAAGADGAPGELALALPFIISEDFPGAQLHITARAGDGGPVTPTRTVTLVRDEGQTIP